MYRKNHNKNKHFLFKHFKNALCTILIFCSFAAISQPVLVASSIIDNNGEWTIGVGAFQFFTGLTSGITPTAGTDVMHFNNNAANNSGTNTVTFAGIPLTAGDYTVTIDVGNFNNLPLSTFDPLTDLGMTAGGTLLVPTSSITPAPALGEILTWTYAYTITAATPGFGQDIGFTITVPNTGANQNVVFDNLNINLLAPALAPVTVPTLSEWVLILLSIMLGLLAYVKIKSQRQI